MGHDRKQGAPGNRASREGVVQRQVAPGKQTLTAALSEQMTGTLQRKAGHDPAAAPQSPGGGGQPMRDDVRAKMERSLGADFSAVRIHEGSAAAAMGALAYTQGTDIHFAPGQYQPDSPGGQELLGHELAHVVQQAQGRVQPTAQAKGVGLNDDSALEREADAMGAKAARGEPAGAANDGVAQPSGSQPVQRKGGGGSGPAPLPAPKRGTKKLAKGDMTWSLSAASQTKVDWSVDFKPDAKVSYKNVSFVQTVVAQVGGNRAYPGTTATDPVGDKTTYSPFEEATDHRRIDHLKGEYDPFYGAEQGGTGWRSEGGSWTVADNKKTSDTAHVTDGPSLSPSRKGLGDASREFETVPTVLETREALGSIKWGFRIKDAANSPVELLNAMPSDCVDTPTAGVDAALDKFYSVKFDAMVDGFAKNDATLSAGHKTQLDGVATKLTATATLKCKLGGAADLSETSPATIAQARATAAKAYLVGKGVTATQIDVESYGSDWAKEKTTAGADEPKNRRVQVWVHP
ncbi:MAG TPA: DUF4157 domain-containing protein [Kofleriaceae bacterium]|nr:DUF4157 domain-containing protein [Kofleriaceae bacterium]